MNEDAQRFTQQTQAAALYLAKMIEDPLLKALCNGSVKVLINSVGHLLAGLVAMHLTRQNFDPSETHESIEDVYRALFEGWLHLALDNLRLMDNLAAGDPEAIAKARALGVPKGAINELRATPASSDAPLDPVNAMLAKLKEDLRGSDSTPSH